MSRTQSLIKDKFNNYFDRLKEMATHVIELRNLLNSVEDTQTKERIQNIIEQLECEMQIYSKELKDGGMEIIKRVA